MNAPDIHLATILAGLAAGETVCQQGGGAGLLGAIEALGARVRRHQDGATTITGVGNGCLLQPLTPVSLDASGEALLVAGLVAPYDMATRVVCTGGFDSDRVATLLDALTVMGIQAEAEGRDAIVFAGQAVANPAVHDAAGWGDDLVAAITFTALGTPGVTRIGHLPRDPAPLVETFSRFGARIDVTAADADGGWSLAVTGQTDMRAPADAGTKEDRG